jgi:hypothetical protein
MPRTSPPLTSKFLGAAPKKWKVSPRDSPNCGFFIWKKSTKIASNKPRIPPQARIKDPGQCGHQPLGAPQFLARWCARGGGSCWQAVVRGLAAEEPEVTLEEALEVLLLRLSFQRICVANVTWHHYMLTSNNDDQMPSSDLKTLSSRVLICRNNMKEHFPLQHHQIPQTPPHLRAKEALLSIERCCETLALLIPNALQPQKRQVLSASSSIHVAMAGWEVNLWNWFKGILVPPTFTGGSWLRGSSGFKQVVCCWGSRMEASFQCGKRWGKLLSPASFIFRGSEGNIENKYIEYMPRLWALWHC